MGVPDSEWARAWAAVYDDDDTVLDELLGRAEFDRRELLIVLRWKLGPRFIGVATKRLADYPEDQIRDTTRRAFAETDDLNAAMTLTTLPSVGVPVASAILTAQNPDRFTIADFRALDSLHAMGFLGDSGNPPNWMRWWVPYLDASRSLAMDWGMSLRDADRALWAARGNLGFPSDSAH